MTLRWLRFAEPAMRFDSDSKETSTQQVDVGPWAPQAVQAQRLMTSAGQWLDAAGTRTYYPGETVAAFDPVQSRAIAGMQSRAMAGSPLAAAAQAQQQATIAGDYLNAGNPYDGAVAQSVRANVLPAVDARFGAAGRFGSPAHAGAVAGAVTNAMAPLAYQSYASERAAQQAAAQNAPAMAQSDYNDLQQLYAAGALSQAQAQRGIDADVARYDWTRDQGQRELQAYRDLIAGNYGQSGMTTNTVVKEQSPWSTVMNTLLGGAKLAQQAGR